MPKTDLVVRFYGLVNEKTVPALMREVDQKLKEGLERLTLLISTPGGSVFHGLSAYNYLKGAPVEVTTHNFGSVDSIGVVLFSAGSRRLSVPQARFLLHSVSIGFGQNERLEEKQLEERLKGLQIDVANIAKVISANSLKSEEEVVTAIYDRTTLNPAQAKEWGIVHNIETQLFQTGAEVIEITA